MRGAGPDMTGQASPKGRSGPKGVRQDENHRRDLEHCQWAEGALPGWGLLSGLQKKDYELLFSVRLAAQCTDERVNKVTPALYARFPTLEALAEADIAEVERYIHSTGFFRAKAKDIVLASQMLLRDYGGRVPGTMEELLKLPGVGRKTANLILGDVYHTPGVVVADTHCIRISGLLGLTDGTKDPGRWSSSCGPSCRRRSPTTSATGWCSMAGRCASHAVPSARAASCGPGVTTSQRAGRQPGDRRERASMIGYGGFGMANAMFTIVPIFIGVVFVLILAGIAVQAVRGAAQWKRNNDAPVLTVEAEVAAKRMDVRTYRHGGTEHSRRHASSRTYYYATFQVESGDRMELEVPTWSTAFWWRGPGAADLPGHPLSGVPPHMSGETE